MDYKNITLERQSLFLENLISLGFSVSASEKEHRIKFDNQMFNLPNQKGFEVVAHFLFSKLNEVSQKKYDIIWPLLEVKARRQFQKSCHSYLTAIAQESRIKFPVISLSLLSSYGESLYELFFAFSTYVVQETNKHFDIPMLERAPVVPGYYDKAIQALQWSTIASHQNFVNAIEMTLKHMEDYFKCASQLMDYINKVKGDIALNESVLADKIKKAKDVYQLDNSFSENSIDDLTLKRKEFQKKVEEERNIVDNFLSNEENMWNFISSELVEENSKPILNGNDYIMPIPNILQDSLKEIGIESVEDGGKLCILNFLKTVSAGVELYTKSIKRSNIPESHLYNPSNEVVELENCIGKLKSVSTSLEKNNASQVLKNDEQMKNIFIGEIGEMFYKDLPPSPYLCFQDGNQTQTDQKTFFERSIVDQSLDEDFKDEATVLKQDQLVEDMCNEEESYKCAENLPFEFHGTLSPHIVEPKIRDVESMFSPLHDDDFRPDFTSTFYASTPGLIPSNREMNFDSVQPKDSKEIPASWLLEESLNAQSLGEELSFLE